MLTGGAGLAGLAAFGSAPALAQAQAGTRLRTYWWGSPDRARRTNEVSRLYIGHHPGMTIDGEVGNGSEYWTKLATQMAARDISDVFQLEPNTLSDFAQRGACKELEPLLPRTFGDAGIAPTTLDLCKVDGKLYGVPLGLNSFSLFYDTTVFTQLGLQPPTPATTWQQYADLAVEITRAAHRPRYAGSAYGARYNYVFDAWLHQRDKGLFTADGRLGFTVDDAREWFTYWEDLRRRGGTVSADVQTLDQLDIETNALTTGGCAMSFTFSNQLVGYQLVNRNRLAITMLPSGGPGTKSGHYYRPALIWSVASTSRNPEAAADYIAFFVSDIEAGRVLGVERGVPVSSRVREVVMPTINEVERATVEFVNLLADKVSAYPPPPPRGSSEFDRNVMRRVADLVAFGSLSPADGAAKLIEEGNAVLARARQ
jgi:multiple sugar transport system substrate-binding protein